MARKILYARKLRINQTDAEKKIWNHLRDRRFLGYKFRRQHPIGTYIVDFCCTEEKLIVELDGSQHLQQQFEDEKRRSELSKLGYRLLRFWDHDVLKDSQSILEAIELFLATSENKNNLPPPPPPPPPPA